MPIAENKSKGVEVFCCLDSDKKRIPLGMFFFRGISSDYVEILSDFMMFIK